MGDSHYKSNLKGKNGTETITEFATIGDDSTAMVADYMKIAAHSYIFGSTYATAASVLAEGVAMDAAIVNSMALGAGGWFHISAAATITEIAASGVFM